MRASRIALFVVSTLAAAFISFANTIDIALARAGNYLLSLWPASAQPLAIAGDYTMQMEIGGTAVPASVLQSLRHEAGVSRRAAARNT
jgi:hypothetical protein